MIETDSQRAAGDVALAPDPTQSPAQPAPVEQGPKLTTKGVYRTLLELGPVVSTLTVLSLTLPGILGTALLFGSVTRLEAMRDWIIAQGSVAPWVAGALMVVTTGSAVLPTYALSFVMGAMFGFAEGGLVAMVGVTAGSLIGYAWGGLLARGRVMQVIDRYERASIVRRALIDRSLLDETKIVGLIRFPPNSPFALTNLVMSSTSVRLIPYTIGTCIGIAPRTLFAVWLGTEASGLAEAQSAGGRERVVVGLVIGIAVFFVVYKILSGWAREALQADTTAKPDAS